MKTTTLNYLAALLLLLCCASFDLTAQPLFCETFDNGVGGWARRYAVMEIVSINGNNVLDVRDSSNESWVYDSTFNHTNIDCGELSYDYTLLGDGFSGTVGQFNQIMLITNFSNPALQLNATFVMNQPIFEGDPTLNIVVPIGPIGPNDPLPSNAFGQWQMLDPSEWNNLINSFTAIGFFVDVVGSNAPTEHFQLDNICYEPAPPFDPTLNLETQCNSGELIATLSTADQTGYTYDWELYQTDQPNQTTGGTLIQSGLTGGSITFNNLNASNFYYVQVTINDICSGPPYVLTQVLPYHEIENIFHFEDAQDNIKTTFCYGEDVYLDGSASYGENNYWIGISRRSFPSSGQAWQDYEFLGWENGEVNEVNLSEAFAALDYDLEPGWEYRITMAIQNVPECVNWVPNEQVFVVECCEEFFDPEFALERRTIPNSSLYELVAVNYETYSNVNIQQTWTLFSSPNLDGGPYTFVDMVSGESFNYQVEEGLCYFVIHSIETLCGDYCFGQSDCINAGVSAGQGTCELCGPIDCSFLNEICTGPSVLQVDCQGWRPVILTASWSPSAAAAGYVVEITWNASECCNSANPEITVEYPTLTNQLVINDLIQPDWNCFRWRVRTICENGGEGWSDYQCFNGCGVRSLDTPTDLPVEITIAPNPTNDFVQVNFEEPFTGDVRLTDKLGRVLQIKTIAEAKRTELDLTALPAGLYWITTQSEAGPQSYKLIKQ